MINIPDKQPDMIRPRMMMTFILAGLLAIIGRLWYLQIAHGDELLDASLGNQNRLIRRLPPRGQIQDRFGRVMATSRDQIVVSVVPEELRKNPAMLPLLAGMLQLPSFTIQEIVDANKISSFDPVRIAEDIDVNTATEIEEQHMNLPGVIIESEPIRYYPDGQMFGHLLGQMGQIQDVELKARRSEGYRPGDYCGKLGLERAYDSLLRGQDGGRKIQVDARGRMRRELGSTAPVPGSTLTLSIDKDVQKVACNELAAWAAKGKPGAAVALDPQTGAVIAMVSVPSYDPNLFVRGITAKDWKGISENPLKPQINRAVGSAYAPGSTFKMITASAGLETGSISPEERIFCAGKISLGKWTKRCHKASGHGSVNMHTALAQSCDVYFYRLGQRLGPDRIAQYARYYGLGKQTGIDLVRAGDLQVERAGNVPTPAWKEKRYHQKWVGGETVDYAIGQAMLGCTPLQMCNVAAAIGNGGTLYRPQLVKTIIDFDMQEKPHVSHTMQPIILHKLPFSSSTIDRMADGMRAVMEPGGTAAHDAIPGMLMAGKTGTAQMRQHGQMINNAWFVGYAPLIHPTIAVCVFVEGGGHGGVTAAPIGRKMIGAFMHLKLTGSGQGSSTD